MRRSLDVVVDRLAASLTRATEAALRGVITRRGPAIERAGDRLRQKHPHLGRAKLARVAMGRRALHVAGTGAASAIPAIIPGPGTTAEVSAALGDLALLTAVQIELVLLIAHLYDRPLGDHEARRLDVLMALGVDAGVVKLGRSGVVTLAGEKIPLAEFDAASIDVLAARVNRKLATQVASRLARRRAHVIIGREIPVLGIGIAATYNLWSTRTIGLAAIRYFEHVS
jgi:uncharacterized protein (DUF697 family)